jgi:elongation factor Ts
MAEITVDLIQKLREKTGLGLLECKKALVEHNGDIEKAFEHLRKKGAVLAEKRSANTTNQGIVYTYIHNGNRIGVMLELNCETDFVAKTDLMHGLAHDLAMHIAATNPLYLSESDVDAEKLHKEKEIYAAQLRNEKKPEHMIATIVEGKMKKFYIENCLLLQPFIKNEEMTVTDRIKEAISKLGENIRLRKFVRYELGR